uniref:Uncharacterized protein n=1 Tax=Fundulus heteroclitus TaxID=8078 RepID=A0A3Q2UQ19_FUNHE
MSSQTLPQLPHQLELTSPPFPCPASPVSCSPALPVSCRPVFYENRSQASPEPCSQAFPEPCSQAFPEPCSQGSPEPCKFLFFWPQPIAYIFWYIACPKQSHTKHRIMNGYYREL